MRSFIFFGGGEARLGFCRRNKRTSVYHIKNLHSVSSQITTSSTELLHKLDVVSISIWTSSERGVIQWNCTWFTHFLSGAATRPNTQVIYKMRPGIFLKAYAVHRIENVNQGCPSPLLLLQLQPVWKLSTGVTGLG